MLTVLGGYEFSKTVLADLCVSDAPIDKAGEHQTFARARKFPLSGGSYGRLHSVWCDVLLGRA